MTTLNTGSWTPAEIWVPLPLGEPKKPETREQWLECPWQDFGSVLEARRDSSAEVNSILNGEWWEENSTKETEIILEEGKMVVKKRIEAIDNLSEKPENRGAINRTDEAWEVSSLLWSQSKDDLHASGKTPTWWIIWEDDLIDWRHPETWELPSWWFWNRPLFKAEQQMW